MNNPVTSPNSNGEFEAVHVPSAEQHADFITKPLHAEAFRVPRNFVMKLRGFRSFVSMFPGIFWGYFLVDWNRKMIFRSEKVLGCTHHASSRVDTPVGCAGGLDDSCCTH